MSKQAIVAREQRWAPYVAASAVSGLVFLIASIAARAGTGLNAGGTLTELLRSIAANTGNYKLAGILAGLGLVALAPPLVFLFNAASARSPRVQRAFIGLCFAGPILLAIQSAVLAFVQANIVTDFITQSQGVGDIYTLANNLFNDASGKNVALALGSAGALAMVFGMVYTPLWAVRTGLLTRFTGTLGMALGASLIFAPIAGVAVPALTVWFAYLGFMFLGRTPSGRGPAWDAGEALPWPKPGEEPVAAGAGGGTVVDGDATEIPGVETSGSSNAARRERAKRKKRKRRR